MNEGLVPEYNYECVAQRKRILINARCIPLGRCAGAEKYGRAGAAQPREAEAGSACLCKTTSTVPRDCPYDCFNCERIQLLVLAPADMAGQTAHLPC